MKGLIFFHDDTLLLGQFEVGIVCTDVKKFVEETPIPPEISSAIRECMQAVEDGSDYAFEGQHGAYSFILSNKSIDDIVNKTLEINADDEHQFRDVIIGLLYSDMAVLLDNPDKMIFSFSDH
jgi:hypothetical protein